MEIRELGSVGLRVPAIGLGCLGMSDYYGRHDDAEAIATIHQALDLIFESLASLMAEVETVAVFFESSATIVSGWTLIENVPLLQMLHDKAINVPGSDVNRTGLA